MRPAIATAFDYRLPLERMLPMARAAGFELVALGAQPSHSGYSTPAGRARLRRLLAANGLALDSVHAPGPEGDQLRSPDESQRLASVRQCLLALEAAAELGGGIVVIHFGMPAGATRE